MIKKSCILEKGNQSHKKNSSLPQFLSLD